MNREYIQAAMRHAEFEVIADPEPYYGQIGELPGVWATGKTEAECREQLAEVVEGWIAVRQRRGMAIPAVDGVRIISSDEPAADPLTWGPAKRRA